MIEPRLRPASRRLVWWFAATTLVLTLALAWVAWIMIRLDRDQELQRQQARREQALDVAVAALARTVAECEQRLSAFSASPAAPIGLTGDRAAFIAFSPGGVVARAGVELPYYPAVAEPSAAVVDKFSAADELELVKHDFGGAIRALVPLSRSADSYLRAEAWLRLGRNYRKAGDVARALDAFQQLSSFGDLIVQGEPSGLMGRLGRALVLSSSGRDADLRRAAAQLSADLNAGRWALTAAQYENGLQQVDAWLGYEQAVAIDLDRASLVGATDAVWREWQTASSRESDAQGRRTVWANDRAVFVLSRGTAGHLAVLLMSSSLLNDAWTANLPPASASGSVSFALTDTDDRFIVGRADAGASPQAVRRASATRLPWNVHAVSAGTAIAPALSGRSQLMLTGVGLMILLIVASGYAISRAVSREARVARLQSDFVAAVSHEFRTPLTTIRQLSEMLVRDRVSTVDKRRLFYDTILVESERLNRLVEGLLDFGRMESGQFEYRFAPVDMPALLRDVAADVEREASPEGYRIELEAPGDLPTVAGDRQALGHVFRNLIDNAVKYSPDHRTIWVNLANGDGRVTVRVRDRGLGIPVDEQREIFQKFVRGKGSTTGGIKGTGIGLALARQIVEAHGGRISVESTPGEGSAFTVALPSSNADVRTSKMGS